MVVIRAINSTDTHYVNAVISPTNIGQINTTYGSAKKKDSQLQSLNFGKIQMTSGIDIPESVILCQNESPRPRPLAVGPKDRAS